MTKKLNIVLYAPEIPQNTGNIMRTVKATNARLHLIKPLGFDLDYSKLKRTSIKYVEDVDMVVYENWDDFVSKNKGDFFFITRYGTKPHSDANFKIDKDIYIVFGNESSGLPLELLKANKESCFRLPMTFEVRSVNLANTVMTVAYEALRQNDYFDLLRFCEHKGKDFI